MLEPQFIQLGPLFINTSDIVYVDFTDENSCMVVLRSLDKKEYVFLPASETLQFSNETKEYHALRAWLGRRTEVLVPQYEQVVDHKMSEPLGHATMAQKEVSDGRTP